MKTKLAKSPNEFRAGIAARPFGFASPERHWLSGFAKAKLRFAHHQKLKK